MTERCAGRFVQGLHVGGVSSALVALAVAAVPLPASAQDAAQSSESAELETVTVSARYVQENLQTAPLAITAVSGVELENRNIASTADLGSIVPNLYTHPGNQMEGPTPTVSLRGVTAGDYSFARDPAVGIYIDDVYHSTMVGADLDLGDLERVEVKRGPQGTLAGNASIAGTISLYSKEPKGDDTGYFSAGYGSYSAMEAKGAYDTRLADNLFMRASGQLKRRNGYLDQLDFTCMMERLGTPELAANFPVRDNSAYQRGCKIGTFGGTSSGSVKIKLRYVVSDDLEVNFSGSYYEQKDEMAPEVLLQPMVPASAAGTANALFQKYGIVFDNRFLRPDGHLYSSYSTTCQPLTGICDSNLQGQDATDYSMKVDYRLTDKINLKVIGAASLYGGVGTNNPDISPLGFNMDQVFFDTNQYTAEARLNGLSFGDRLEWVGGVFYLNSRNRLSGNINIPSVVFTEDDHFKTKSVSAFLHGDYSLTERLRVSAGLRYAKDDKTAALNHPGLIENVTPFSVNESHEDWLLSADYRFTDNVMGYVTAATGHRPPGISTVVFTKDQLSSFPGEAMTSYEIGLKNELFDRRVRFNINAFYMDYSKRLTGQTQFQCLSGPLAGPPPVAVLFAADCGADPFVPWPHTIAAPAEVRGFEWEITAQPTRGLLVNWSGGYNKFESGVKTLGTPGYVFPGNVPQPEWNMSGGIQYAIRLPFGSITPRFDWFYQSVQTFGPAASNQAPTPLYSVPGHSVFNAQLSYVPVNSKWDLSVSATNLTDKYYLYSVFSGSGSAVTGSVAEPRMIFFRLRRDFD
jgi:iron complex outermembrane receptor protein